MTACASLLCDNCVRPGRCCKGFHLGGGGFGRGKTKLEVLVMLASVVTVLSDSGRPHIAAKSGPAYIGLPFLPDQVDAGGAWLFMCPLLGQDGRCTEYEARPPLCRSYEAGSDPLCAMYVDPPSRDDEVFAKNPEQ